MTDAALRAAERAHGDVWRRLDRITAAARDKGLRWPAWIHAPVAESYAALADPRTGRVPLEFAAAIPRVAALAAWRVTKSIYRYDPDLLAELWDSSLESVSVSALHHLPEWCVYLDLPDREVAGIKILGAYVHLERDANDGHEELRVLLVRAEPVNAWERLFPLMIHLGRGDGTIADGISRAWDEAQAQDAAAGPLGEASVLATEQSRLLGELACGLAPIVSCVLFLCSAEPDLRDEAGLVERPTRAPIDRKRGVARAAQRTTTWAVGKVLGVRLRQAKAHGGGSKAPHVRRAHWHTYWVGSEQGDDRRCEPRWVSHILVLGGRESEHERLILDGTLDGDAVEATIEAAWPAPPVLPSVAVQPSAYRRRVDARAASASEERGES